METLMDLLLDSIARILATEPSRRKMLRLLGGAFASAVVGAFAVQPLSATTCTPDQVKYGAKTCGGGPNQQCCPPKTCCVAGGQAKTSRCCDNGMCYCANGSCAASKGGKCPGGCTMCTAA
jgi:hypothetical protein